MKNLIPLFVAYLAIAGCTRHSEGTSPDYTKGATNARLWSGTHTRGYASGGALPGDPINFNYAITDTSLTVLKVDNNTVTFQITNIPLKYKRTDSTMQTVTFDSSISGSFSPTLTYYYLADSMVFSYTILSMGMYGMDDPVEENYFLYTHK